MKKFNHQLRAQNIIEIEQETFDVLIVGGGINGAGIARDAAMRGMKVALIEQNDFASGTSSRSSKLIHGGIRYLENLEFKLVFEALSERSLLFEIAPHLVHPLKFMIPLFKSSRVGMFKMGLGMWLYDLLALFQAPEIHDRLSRKQTILSQPEVRNVDLVGSFTYFDAYMDDDRLVHETLRSASESGAKIVNYIKAIEYSFNGQIHSIRAQDFFSGSIVNIKAKQVVSCVGPWTDLFAPLIDKEWKKVLRPTKGIHLIVDRKKFNLHQAVVMGAETGNRIIFGIPRGDFVIIGTTDTDYQEDPFLVRTDKEDVQYLLKIVNSYFPQVNLTQADLISSYSGVRPLVKDEASSTGKTSREHVIIKGKNDVFFVVGGKYTTYRKIAEEVVDKLIKELSIEEKVLFGKTKSKTPINPLVTAESYYYYLNIQETREDYWLAQQFGPEVENIKNSYPNYSVIQKIAAFHIDYSMCISIFDFYLRRSFLMLTLKDHGLSQFQQISKVFKDKLNYSDSEIDKDLEQIKNHIQREMHWM
ncbi:MAG: glycerol-3-phosphate dehydrogenase/oxidase [Bdellovibrionaceae bacterium]|nr:glycerol-3-phosphate dehydrogenase/oxidase [Pseudobdellovibrionaceae bacterium]